MALSKYRNRKVVVDGMRFDSKKEAARWGELKLMQRAGEISDLERQVRIPLMVGTQKIGHYIADFVYRDRAGVKIVEDCKGFRTEVYILKAKIMRANGIEIKET